MSSERARAAAWALLLASAGLFGGCYLDRETEGHAGAAGGPRDRDAAPGRGDAATGEAAATDAAPASGGTGGGAPATGGTIALDEDAGVDADDRVGPRIAFFGDQSLSEGAEAVLRLIASRDVDAVVHLGDFDYVEDPQAWLAMRDAYLDPELPYLAVVGNHDVPVWEGPDGYQELQRERLSHARGLTCEGELGWRERCEVGGVSIVLSGVGSYGEEGHEAYLERTLAADTAPFRICAWHKNQHDMQVGGKPDEVGWLAYQTCQAHGALIVTGHEHSYSRTYTLSDLGNASAGHGRQGAADQVRLSSGTTAVIVSGLGGRGARDYLAASHDDDTWWASIYARRFQRENGRASGREVDIAFGALFIDFGIDADPRRARGYFVTVEGVVADRFDLVSEP